MAYLIYTDVMLAIQEDMDYSLMCYEDKATKDVVRFCYESMAREINKLPQYRLENVKNANVAAGPRKSIYDQMREKQAARYDWQNRK